MVTFKVHIKASILFILESVWATGIQMFGDVDNLDPYSIPIVPGKSYIPIKFIGVPSLSDGKVCAIWSDFVKFVGI